MWVQIENDLNISKTENELLRKQNEVLQSKIESFCSLSTSQKITEDPLTSNDQSSVSSGSSSASSSSNENIEEVQKELESVRNDIKELQVTAARNEIHIQHTKDAIEIVDDRIQNSNSEIQRVEKYIMKTSQYGRRNNLIIDGIPDNVPQDRLEGVCVDIIRRVGFHIRDPFEIEGCHRLRKDDDQTCRPVIIRFVNRKVKEFCIKHQWRLPRIGYTWSCHFVRTWNRPTPK